METNLGTETKPANSRLRRLLRLMLGLSAFTGAWGLVGAALLKDWN